VTTKKVNTDSNAKFAMFSRGIAVKLSVSYMCGIKLSATKIFEQN